jgi:hypothetical protein
MKRSRTVGRNARAAWVTRAEAAYLARVPLEEIDRWIASGRLANRQVGSVLLVDLSGLRQPATPPAEARSVRGARARSGRATRPVTVREPKRTKPAKIRGPKPAKPADARRVPAPRARPLDRPAVVVGGAAAITIVALLVLQFALFGGVHRPPPLTLAASSPSSAITEAPSIPVGRDPFADPFGANRKGDKAGGVLVKPPGVVRDGGGVTAATTVVNQDDRRWLPPSELTFVARDDNGRVIARTSTTVSLGPGRAETVVAPDLDVDPSAIAAIETHIRPAPLRSGTYHAPPVTVLRAGAVDDGKAIAGLLSVGADAPSRTTLACVMFDGLDEIAGVTTKIIGLGAARDGRLRFWLTAQPTTAGPYKVSCSASSARPSAT